ncbi:MAG: CrcB family protein [Actinomycetota bacterium]
MPVGWRELVAVGGGGVLGTGARLTLDAVIPHGDTTFPWSTLIINVVGSFALGALVSTLWKRRDLPNWLRAGLGAGLIGSFTTFSAVMVSLVAEGAHGEWMLAIAYLAATLLLGFAAAVAGIALGGRRGTAPDLVDE